MVKNAKPAQYKEKEMLANEVKELQGKIKLTKEDLNRQIAENRDNLFATIKKIMDNFHRKDKELGSSLNEINKLTLQESRCECTSEDWNMFREASEDTIKKELMSLEVDVNKAIQQLMWASTEFDRAVEHKNKLIPATETRTQPDGGMKLKEAK